MKELFQRISLTFLFFFTDKVVKDTEVKLPKEVKNNFKKLRMSYYRR